MRRRRSWEQARWGTCSSWWSFYFGGSKVRMILEFFPEGPVFSFYNHNSSLRKAVWRPREALPIQRRSQGGHYSLSAVQEVDKRLITRSNDNCQERIFLFYFFLFKQRKMLKAQIYPPWCDQKQSCSWFSSLPVGGEILTCNFHSKWRRREEPWGWWEISFHGF